MKDLPTSTPYAGPDGRVPLNDSERRIIKGADGIGCAPLAICIIGFAIYAVASWDVSGFLVSLGIF